MRGLFRLFLFLCLLFVCGAQELRALGYRDALKAYEKQEYSKCYKISVALVKKVRATERAKLFILAGAAVLELDRETLARSYFRKALFYNPKIQLPSAVRSPRVHRYLDDVRTSKLSDPEDDMDEEVEPAFDQPKTYLPLGINQMLQKKWILGLAFAAGQVLPLYFAYENFESAARVDRLSAQSTAEAIASGDDINPVYIKYISDNNRYADKARQQAQFQILLAIGSYAASIAEAGINPITRSGVARAGGPFPKLLGWQLESSHVTLSIQPNFFGGGHLALKSEF